MRFGALLTRFGVAGCWEGRRAACCFALKKNLSQRIGSSQGIASLMRTKSLVERDLEQLNVGHVEANFVSHNAAIGCGFESRSKDCSIHAVLYIEQFTEPLPTGIQNGFRDFDVVMLSLSAKCWKSSRMLCSDLAQVVTDVLGYAFTILVYAVFLERLSSTHLQRASQRTKVL